MSDTAADSHLGTMHAADLGVSSSGQRAGDASSSAAPISIRNVDILAHVPFRLDFEADNYAEWQDAMLSVLAQFGVTDHVEAPGHGEHDDEWVRVDVTVVLWIYTTISDELLDEVMTAHSTAHEVWTLLHAFFGYEADQLGFDVRQEFRDAVQGDDMSVADYCWRMKALADALADMGEPVEDRALTMQMLRGLSPRLRVMGTMLVHACCPSFMQAFGWLLLEESNLNQAQGGAQ